MTREEQIQDAYDAYYDGTWDEHGGKAKVVDGYHDIWFPSQATEDFFKAGAEWADKHPIEVKEVDLKKEIDNIWNPRFNLGWDEKSLLSVNHEGFTTIAKHFYELGLKAQKGE